MFLQLGDVVMHAQVDGPPGGAVPAPPVLLLHSIGTSLHVFDPQVPALARHHRVVRMDLRGHGNSGVTEGPYSMALHAADACALLDALGLPAAHVVGLSIGGRIAMEMAASTPERVLSLLLLDTAAEFPPLEAWQERIDAVLAHGSGVLADTVMPRWVVDPSTASAKGLRQMLERTDRHGYAGSAAALRDAIPGSRLVTLREAGHIPNLEQPEATTAAILDHLRALGPQPGAEGGLAVRTEVLGEAHVARARANVTPLDAAFQEWITANVWGGVWTRPGLPRHTRSLLTLAMMAALGRHEEFELHVRATRNTGVTPEELAELLLQVGAYAGVPAANSALKIARQVLREDGRLS